MLLCACLALSFNAISLAKVPTENLKYSVENQGVNVKGVNAIGNYAYIKLEKAAGYPKLNEALNVYVGDLENRIYDDLTETKNQISQGKKADIEKSMGHFESVIEVTRADNLVFSFQEQSLVWIDNYVPNIDIKYFNYDTQTGTLLNHNNVFKNESAVADLVAKTFTANNPEVKLPMEAKAYFGKRLSEEGYCFTGIGLKVILGNDMGIPVSVEIPYAQLVEYVKSDYVPLQVMNERRQKISNI